TRNELAAIAGINPQRVAILVADLNLSAVGGGPSRRYPRETALAIVGRAKRAPGIATSNHYLTALKCFLNWMDSDRRAPQSPLRHLRRGNPDTDRRHDRRNLSPEELVKLFEVTRQSSTSFRELTGEDRYHLYLTAAGTGFRASELASLSPRSFQFDSN